MPELSYPCHYARASITMPRRLGHNCAQGTPARSNAGLSLLEVMVAVSIFTILAFGVLSAMLQTRRISEANAAQAVAMTFAQGIIEQAQLVGYTGLVNDANLSLKFSNKTGGNLTSLDQFSLPWASDAVTFTEVGSLSDPTDPTSAVLGVMLDTDYISNSTLIRSAHYMKMRVNLQRNPHVGDDNVEITLTYQWRPPTRSGTTLASYITREIRTIRSQSPSF